MQPILEQGFAADEFFASHPELASTERIAEISSAFLRWARIDLDRAQRLVEAARWLAVSLDDPSGRGLATRIEGHYCYLTSRFSDARSHYREAVDCFRRAGDEVEEALTLSTSTQVLIYAGAYDDARCAVERARAVLKQRGDRLALARLANNEGNIWVRLDRYGEALALYEEALAGFRRHGGTPEDEVAALMNVAVCQTSLNRLAEAMASYRQLLRICAEHDMQLVAIRAEYNIGYLHYQRGEYATALELYQKTREASRRVGDRFHEALCALDQAEILLELNLAGDAARMSSLAFAAFEDLGVPYEAAKALVFLAVAEHRERRPFKALERFEEARALFAGEGNEAWPHVVDLYRALIFLDEGRLFEALRLAESCTDFFVRNSYGSKAVVGELLIARIQLGIGEVGDARERCDSALRRAEDLASPMLGYQANLVMGRIDEELGETDAARRVYQRALHHLDDLRINLRSDELKIAFFSDKLDVYHALVWLELARERAPLRSTEVLGLIEKAKSRSLTELLATRSNPLLPASQSPLVQRMGDLRGQLNWYYRRMDREQLEGTSPARHEELRRECARCEEDLLATLREVRANHVEIASLHTGASLRPEDIRETLPPRTRILEYFETRGTIVACVWDRENLEIHSLTRTSRVREIQRRLQFQLSKFRLGDDYVERYAELLHQATMEHLGSLHRVLVAPVSHLLGEDDLVVVPHGVLHHVPFHALVEEDGGFLGDRVTVSYAPSASVYAMCRLRERRATYGALVMGVPDEGSPAVAEEVRAVADLLPGSELAMGADATEHRLRTVGRDRRYVHLATHGLFREDNPMFSSIQLGDSRLTLLDLYHLELNADLVVLSGCGTGLNVVRNGDELIGLTRGLLYAGASSVVVSLWDVHDRWTAELMTTFYRHLQREPRRAVALRRTLREIRQKMPHPFYWAPFILVGDPGDGDG